MTFADLKVGGAGWKGFFEAWWHTFKEDHTMCHLKFREKTYWFCHDCDPHKYGEWLDYRLGHRK